MALLIPANSGTSVVTMTTGETRFQVLGPIPADRWLDLIFVNLWVGAATGVSMAWTVSASPDAGQDAFTSGVPLITRSDAVLLGIPSVNLIFASTQSHNFTFAVGRRIATGPSFVHTGVLSTANVDLSLVTSARILGLGVETRERLGRFEEVRLP